MILSEIKKKNTKTFYIKKLDVQEWIQNKHVYL